MAKTRKPKLPKMTPERKAIMEANRVSDHNALNLHGQLCLDLDRLVEVYQIDTKGKTPDTVGNEILVAYFANEKKRQEEEPRDLRNSLLRTFYANRFQRIFGLPIRKFMSNLTLGFDEVVKPGNNESTADAILRKWGSDAKGMIETLVSPPTLDTIHMMLKVTLD